MGRRDRDAPLRDATGAQVRVSTEVHASADTLYEMVADLPRMGEWSPECQRVEWIGSVRQAVVGATFKGHNRNGLRRWSTHGTVTVADPGREFAFEVRSVLDLSVSRWSYRFEQMPGGRCHVTESTEDRRGALIRLIGAVATGVGNRAERNRDTMTITLERLRVAAEGGAAAAQDAR